MSRGDGLGFAMPRHLGSVSSGSAVPGIVVLRKTPDDVSEFVKQYRNLRFRRVSVVTRNRQYVVTAGPREHSPWFPLHEKRSTVEEWPVGVQLDDGVSARILHRSRRPWMFEELLTFKVPPAISAGRPAALQLEVQRPEHFGGVMISFPEPNGARIFVLQDAENLLTRPSDRLTVLAQGRQLQQHALVLVWSKRSIRSARRKQYYAREYGSCDHSLA
jgi:hypothetical protein